MPTRTTRLAILLIVVLLGGTRPAFGEEIGIGTGEGEMHPDFTLPDLSGEPRQLSGFRGRKLLLLHFASW